MHPPSLILIGFFGAVFSLESNTKTLCKQPPHGRRTCAWTPRGQPDHHGLDWWPGAPNDRRLVVPLCWPHNTMSLVEFQDNLEICGHQSSEAALVRWREDFTKDQDCFDKEDPRGAHIVLSPEDQQMLVGFILHPHALYAQCSFQDVHQFVTHQLDKELSLGRIRIDCYANCIFNLVTKARSASNASFL